MVSREPLPSTLEDRKDWVLLIATGPERQQLAKLTSLQRRDEESQQAKALPLTLLESWQPWEVLPTFRTHRPTSINLIKKIPQRLCLLVDYRYNQGNKQDSIPQNLTPTQTTPIVWILRR